MSDKLPISVFIVARDEADRIARTIESVRDRVDEVIVIDSGSRDDWWLNLDAGEAIMPATSVNRPQLEPAPA